MKALITSVLLIFSVALSAQEPFIEIIVSESVMLKPIQIEYVFSTTQTMTFMGMPMPTGGNDDKTEDEVTAKMAIGFLEEALKKKKFKYTLRQQEPVVPTDTEIREEIAVTVYSLEELEKLKEVGKSVAGISGKVGNVSHELTPAVKNTLFEKLYATALEEVTLLAAAQQMKPGKILSLKEVEPSLASLNSPDYMNQAMSMMKTMFSGSGDAELSKTYTRSFTFRFALEPR